MAAATSRLNFSYYLLENCLPLMNTLVSEASPALEKEDLEAQATALSLRFSALYARAPSLSEDFFSYLMILVKREMENIAVNSSVPEGLPSATLVLKLLTPIAPIWEASFTAPPVAFSDAEHEAKITTIKAHWEKLRENITRAGRAASGVFTPLIERMGSAVRQLEIDSVTERRRVALKEALDEKALQLRTFTAYVSSADLTAAEELAKASAFYQKLNGFLLEAAAHAKELGGESFITCDSLFESIEATKAHIFTRLSGQLETKIASLAAKKDKDEVLRALEEIEALLHFTKGIPAMWSTATRGCEKAIVREADRLIKAMILCKGDLQCQKLENMLTIIESAKKDFPEFKDLPAALLAVLNSFKAEYRILQRIWIETGLAPPGERAARMETISSTYYALTQAKQNIAGK